MTTVEQLSLEVLHEVCQYLRAHDRERAYRDSPTAFATPHAYPGWNTIVALARTCRLFHGPALDTIWHTLPSVTPLLYTMPRDCWETDWMGQEPDDTVRRRLYFTRELYDRDFERLQLHAPRVRRILREEDCIALPPRGRSLSLVADSVLEAFVSRFPAGALLPRLQVLHQAHGASPLQCRALSMLAGPHLRNLSDQMLTGSIAPELAREDGEFCRALAMLQERSPGLVLLQLHSSVQCYPVMNRAVSDALCGFRRLQHVSLEPFPISAHALEHLSTLPSLHTLDVWVLHVDLSQSEDQLSESGMPGSDEARKFPALRELSLTQGHPGLAACTSALARIRPPCLRTLTVKSTSYLHYAPVDEISGLLCALGAAPCCATVRSVTVEVNGLVRDSDELPGSALRPLLRLAHLETLDVDVRCLVAVDDALLHAMSRAWPRIAFLHLGIERVPQRIPRPRATLAGLLGFAHRSPHLKSLGLHMCTDVKTLPRTLLEVRPGRGAVQRGLGALYVGRSHLAYEDVLPVASFLSDVFPGLLEVECGWAFEDDDDDDDDGDEDGDNAEVPVGVRLRDPHWAERRREAKVRKRWDRVLELVSVFERVRHEERRWAVRRGKKLLTPADAGL